MAKTQGHGNPPWTRDETLLALDLYFKCKGKLPSPSDPRVVDLSNLLRMIPWNGSSSRQNTYRNPAGVAFKLQNIRNVATGEGLGNVSKTDRNLWSEFCFSSEKVSELANLIRETITSQQFSDLVNIAVDEEEFSEGRILTEYHRRKERHPVIRKRLIASRRINGGLTCDMCYSPGRSADPNIEDAEFEAHHLLPIGMALERKTRLSDMALLCASCHRLLHRAITYEKRWLRVDEGRKIVVFKVTKK